MGYNSLLCFYGATKLIAPLHAAWLEGIDQKYLLIYRAAKVIALGHVAWGGGVRFKTLLKCFMDYNRFTEYTAHDK
jgi:hypothetical protein